MLFLHGYLSNKESFTAQIQYFSRFFRVTAIDFLGFGKSGDLTVPFDVGDYANWLEEVMTALGVKKPHVIAHSFGCRVAVKLAAAKRDIFDKIILTGPAGIILPRKPSYHIKVRTYKCVKKLFPQFAERHFGSEEYRSLSPIMKQSYKKIVNEDLRKCAGQVCNETLIIQGMDDRVTTREEAVIYQNALQNATIEYIDGGHFAFAENPVLFNIKTEEFIYG